MLHASSASSSTFNAYTPESLFRRALPFLFALGVGLALIPIQDVPVDALQLAGALVALALLLLIAVGVGRKPWLPLWVGTLLPFAYLASIALLRSATGGTLSGYGVLLYLAPFWVAMYGSRREVVSVMIGLFVVQAVQGSWEVDFDSYVPLRRALLGFVVIGMMSIAVQRSVSDLRATERQLEEQATQLERSNRELEQFAYVSSHDLQEPLRMIRSFSQLFLQRHGNEVSADGKELLDFVTDGAQRAQTLVNDLLEYSRVETTGQELDSVCLNQSLERALETLRPRIEDSNATIERIGDMPQVSGDANQLDRLFVNLIGNAIKYSDPERAPKVTIHAIDHAEHVEVQIIDNGIGIDNQHAERVFLMFQRLHGRDQYEGTGIGLAICARIVERHGGKISASGVPGKGATFTFTLEHSPA